MMIKKMNIAFLFLTTFLTFGQNYGDTINNHEVDDISGFKSKAIPVYNHAYNENYDGDNIADIIENAKNAYVLVDPFGNDIADAITTIKANGNEVGAYISIGTGEDWRDDYNEMKPYIITTAWDEWKGEYFVNEVTTGVVDIMKARIDKIAAWGCDWVEFDNMDWASYDDVREKYELKVTKAEGIAYYNKLCDYVHAKGMKCMAKNTVEEGVCFDGVLYESYKKDKNWWDQSGAQSFLDVGKIVIINHYGEKNCGKVYANYKEMYNKNVSFICEDITLRKYIHFNQ
ncbi:endo alpha-1,4 polygalactosaminidase [Aquimarina pacifica]|uniref:endo alpha-1,4 polygalactosaminidase n=1 Tax=Aquimarina pacifica TaxID=1296415 RepID=UPI0009DC9901|nr:endo alpha-1,4 polygalactosaminidase [Aquimarina pacifica]